MDDEDFKKYLRLAGFIVFCVMGSMLTIYLLIVAGWATSAYVNQLSPDLPVCVHQQLCQDRYGALVQCTRKYLADDAGHAINLPVDPEASKDAGRN
jgi:hypothetical protein